MITLTLIWCSFAHPTCRMNLPMPDMRTCIEEAHRARIAGAHAAFCIRD